MWKELYAKPVLNSLGGDAEKSFNFFNKYII
jgi:hypothetical protein